EPGETSFGTWLPPRRAALRHCPNSRGRASRESHLMPEVYDRHAVRPCLVHSPFVPHAGTLQSRRTHSWPRSHELAIHRLGECEFCLRNFLSAHCRSGTTICGASGIPVSFSIPTRPR